MSRLILRVRLIRAASSALSAAGFSKMRSGAPITPTSCSRAATSIASRSVSGRSMFSAQAEQVSATRKACPAAAAFLHCNAANRLAAMPRRICTS